MSTDRSACDGIAAEAAPFGYGNARSCSLYFQVVLSRSSRAKPRNRHLAARRKRQPCALESATRLASNVSAVPLVLAGLGAGMPEDQPRAVHGLAHRHEVRRA